jgi:hypothetical protein
MSERGGLVFHDSVLPSFSLPFGCDFPTLRSSRLCSFAGLLLLVLILPFGATRAAQAPAAGSTPPRVTTGFPDYKIGDVAQEDILTPVPLEVNDPVETDALKSQEAMRVPVICRYYTNAVTQAEADLNAAFALARSNFLERLDSVFNSRDPKSDDVPTARFQRLLSSSIKASKTFPLTTNLAVAWALHDPDEPFRAALAANLRGMQTQYLRPANIPPEVKFGASVRLVPLANWEDSLPEQPEKRGFTTAKSNVVTITRARDALLESYPPEERATAKFLGSLLKTNCLPDVAQTLAARDRRTEHIVAVTHYAPAQVIVRRGEIIDSKIKAALDQLRERTALGALQQQLRYEHLEAAQAYRRQLWLVGGMGAVLIGLFLVAWRQAGRRPGAVPAVVRPRALPSGEATLALEPASASQAEIKRSLLPHIARVLKDAVVRRLLAQRTGLIDIQQRAAQDIAELEARLQQLHSPLQQRLEAYEQRINDLERELVQKGEENKELIKAKILMARKQLEAEKAKNRVELN